MKNKWQTKTLADTCQFSNGLWKGERPPFVRVGVIRNTNFTSLGTLDYSDIAYLDVEEKKFASRQLKYGDIILEKSGGGPKQPVGRVALFDQFEGDYSFSNFTAALRVQSPNEMDFRFLHKFLYWTYLSGITEGMQSHSTGIRNLDGGAYKTLRISFPSLLEQQRIVGMLDAAFDGIATAKANAEQNLRSARALFESYLNAVFQGQDVDWVAKNLEEVVDASCSLSYGIVQPGDEFSNGLPIVRPTDLSRKMIRPQGLKRIDPKRAAGYKRTTLHGGELLLCVRGSTGVVAIADPELAGANVTRGIVPIRFDDSLLLPDFGYYLICSDLVQSQIREKTYGAALMQINIRDLRVISLLVPPLSEQATIAARLEEVEKDTNHLAHFYQMKLAEIEALKKSLLHQAFTGQL